MVLQVEAAGARVLAVGLGAHREAHEWSEELKQIGTVHLGKLTGNSHRRPMGYHAIRSTVVASARCGRLGECRQQLLP